MATWLKKFNFHSNHNEGQAKECSNYSTIALISHTSKVMLKILQARLQQYVNCELPDVQAGFRKDRGTRDQIASIIWFIERNKRLLEKHLLLLYWLCQNLCLCGPQQTLEKIGVTDHLTYLLRIRIHVMKPQLELDIEQQTDFK